ncbi:hypothetical protein B0T10DRAFT_497833 [Thelonectria olida]|uniref:Fungal N-terminal domain-containing protein n=1 Tax=Thelonectria olida TaxID=1576542 RepID=A0A9P9AJS5_9HYPO|nr:hypothetical protein B0T10DRAFT_497833 [Thelonectria olida]
MDPITILGAVAGAVQLLDASIKSSKKTRSFISDFRHAGDDVQRLETAMKEAEALMNDLQSYGTIVQQCPPDVLAHHSHVLSSSLCQIALNYAEDVKDLGRLLPSNSTLPIKERFSFARNQNAVSVIMFRLEQRKTATTLALEILGRIEGIKQHTRGLEVEKSLQALTCQQSHLSADLKTFSDAVTEQGHKGMGREANMLSSIEKLQGLVLGGEHASTQSRELLLEQAKQLSLIDTRLLSIHSSSEQSSSALLELTRALQSQRSEVQASLASMEARAASRHRQLATTSQVKTIASSSANELGAIVRLELKKQLEPLRHRFEVTDQIIHGLATAVAAQASGQKVFEGDNIENVAKTKSLDNRDAKVLGLHCSSVKEPRTARVPRDARLFTYRRIQDTIFGRLVILLTTYRTKARGLHDTQAHFTLKVDLVPHPWLISRGISLLYSTGPGPDGYFDICPKIRSFGVILNDSPIWSILRNDEVSAFRNALQTRQIGLWGLDSSGCSFVVSAFLSKSWGILFYLLRETGYAETLLARNFRSARDYICLLAIAWPLNVSTCREIISLVEENSDPPDHSSAILGDVFIWHNLWLKARQCMVQFPHAYNSEQSRQFVLFYKEYGISFEPRFFLDPLVASHGYCSDVWGNVEYFFGKLEYLLQLYLTTGGNPNATLEGGHPLLVAMFIYVDTHLMDDEIEDGYSMDEKGITDPFESIGDSEFHRSHLDANAHRFGDTSEFLDGNAVSHYGCDASPDDEGDIHLCPRRSKRWRCVYLLALLISSGADIYWFLADDSATSQHQTIFTMASRYGALDIWLASLQECGLCPGCVLKELHHRMRSFDQLRGTKRTGVDVADIVKEHDVRGLRGRGGGRKFNED